MVEMKLYHCLNCNEEIMMRDVGQFTYDDENTIQGKTKCPFCGGNMEKRKTTREQAQEKVYVYMCRGDIEDECIKRGIKVTKNRSKMEQALIEAYTKEWSK
jgi:DNA-directed RNA polymerase subunit RPC12/RpoP